MDRVFTRRPAFSIAFEDAAGSPGHIPIANAGQAAHDLSRRSNVARAGTDISIASIRFKKWLRKRTLAESALSERIRTIAYVMPFAPRMLFWINHAVYCGLCEWADYRAPTIARLFDSA
jgi:hypothetical protein